MTTAKRQTLGDFMYYSLCEGQSKAGRVRLLAAAAQPGAGRVHPAGEARRPPTPPSTSPTATSPSATTRPSWRATCRRTSSPRSRRSPRRATRTATAPAAPSTGTGEPSTDGEQPDGTRRPAPTVAHGHRPRRKGEPRAARASGAAATDAGARHRWRRRPEPEPAIRPRRWSTRSRARSSGRPTAVPPCTGARHHRPTRSTPRRPSSPPSRANDGRAFGCACRPRAARPDPRAGRAAWRGAYATTEQVDDAARFVAAAIAADSPSASPRAAGQRPPACRGHRSRRTPRPST